MIFSVLALSCLAAGTLARPEGREEAGSHRSVPTVASIREYFYAGGSYADNGSGGHIFKDQAYVEHLTPAKGTRKRYPIVFIHGQAQTGTNWLNKPDGGNGWANYFLAQGYEIYIVDQTYRGRSPFFPGNGTQTTYSAELLQQRFTAARAYNLWPQSSLHTQWNGAGVMGDAVFDAYYSSTVQFLSGSVQQQTSFQAAGAALLDRIGKPVILIAHSQGGLMPWLIADVRPALTHSIVSIEPSGPPFHEAVFSSTASRAYGLTDAPITYSPAVTSPSTDLVTKTIYSSNTAVSNCTLQADENPRQLVNLAKIPVLLVTSESSYHVPYDWCTVKYLQQAGVKTTHLKLEQKGLRGNGHMMFLEKNSDDVARVLQTAFERL